MAVFTEIEKFIPREVERAGGNEFAGQEKALFGICCAAPFLSPDCPPPKHPPPSSSLRALLPSQYFGDPSPTFLCHLLPEGSRVSVCMGKASGFLKSTGSLQLSITICSPASEPGETSTRITGPGEGLGQEDRKPEDFPPTRPTRPRKL